MKGDDYQFETGKTALYPEAGTGSKIALCYTALGLASEAGEVAGKIKKMLRDDGGSMTPARAEQIFAELGDTAWYLARVCSELGFGFSNVLLKNVEKLASRYDRGVIRGSGDTR